MLTTSILFAAALAVILLGCHVFTNGVEWLGKRLDVSDGVVGSIFAGVGTALPETMIPLMAIVFADSATSDAIGIGAIIGAPFMLATLSLPLGALGVIVFARMGKRDTTLNLDTRQLDLELRLFLLAFSVALFCAMVPSRALHIGASVFLILLYVYYVRKTIMEETDTHDEGLAPLMFARHAKRPGYAIIGLQIFIALAAIVGGAHLFVGAVEEVSVFFGISALVLSLLITPVATELPEKMNSLIWLFQRKDQMAVGNITGAMVFQGTFPVVIGLLGTSWVLPPEAMTAGALAVIAAAIYLFMLRIQGGLRVGYLLFGAAGYAGYAIYIIRG